MLFFFQAEDGIRYLVRSRGLGDVYKRQQRSQPIGARVHAIGHQRGRTNAAPGANAHIRSSLCLLYTSDAADERSSVDLGGRRIIKKKKTQQSHEPACMHKNTHVRTTDTLIRYSYSREQTSK